jgi:hypothetical protein
VALMRYKPDGGGFNYPWAQWGSIYLIIPHYGPGADSACNRKEQ